MAADREVRIITGGTHNVEPPGLQAMALPDTVPPPDPAIPFEDYRTLLVPFTRGDINPFLVIGEDQSGTGQASIVPAADGGTDFVIDLPAAFDTASKLAGAPVFFDLRRDAFAARVLLAATGPAPVPGQDFQIFCLLFSTNNFSEFVGIFHSQGSGFVFSAQLGGSSGSVPLCPYVQGSEYDFRWQYRRLAGGAACLSVKAKKDGVVVASTSFSLPTQGSGLPFLPAVNVSGFTSSPASFRLTMREFGIGYQPLAAETPSCP